MSKLPYWILSKDAYKAMLWADGFGSLTDDGPPLTVDAVRAELDMRGIVASRYEVRCTLPDARVDGEYAWSPAKIEQIMHRLLNRESPNVTDLAHKFRFERIPADDWFIRLTSAEHEAREKFGDDLYVVHAILLRPVGDPNAMTDVSFVVHPKGARPELPVGGAA